MRLLLFQDQGRLRINSIDEFIDEKKIYFKDIIKL